jgi:hypothetical protein
MSFRPVDGIGQTDPFNVREAKETPTTLYGEVALQSITCRCFPVRTKRAGVPQRDMLNDKSVGVRREM